MPQNPDLFPTDYPDLCPRTELQEEDCCDEMGRLIRTLRNQHLLAARRAGQSIAELQNQSMIDECCVIPVPVPTPSPSPTPTPAPTPTPTPPPSNGGTRCVFMAGGEMQGIHGQVEKFVHSTLVVSVMDFSISVRMRHAGAATAGRGYWFGGVIDYPNWDGQTIKTIEGINFDTETRRTISNQLTLGYFYDSNGAFSEAKAFIGGYAQGAGYPGNGVGHDRFTFATETAATGGYIPSVAYGAAGGQSTTKAYFAGGGADILTFAAIPFETETPGTIGATLSMYRQAAGCLSSARKLYMAGGSQNAWGNRIPTRTRTIDALVFATETCGVIGAQITSDTDDVEGWGGSGTWGVMAGGQFLAPSRRLQKLRFDSDTCEEVNATLRRGGRYPVMVGKP